MGQHQPPALRRGSRWAVGRGTSLAAGPCDRASVGAPGRTHSRAGVLEVGNALGEVVLGLGSTLGEVQEADNTLGEVVLGLGSTLGVAAAGNTLVEEALGTGTSQEQVRHRARHKGLSPAGDLPSSNACPSRWGTGSC